MDNNNRDESMKYAAMLILFLVGWAFMVELNAAPAPRLWADERIIGGEDAKPGKWNAVAIRISTGAGSFGCTGSLIASEWVLTAAHCLPGAKSIKVFTGNDLADFSGEWIAAKTWQQHPGYNNVTMDNDAALIELVKPSTAKLIPLGGVLPGKVWAIGFGATKYSKETGSTGASSKLKEVELDVMKIMDKQFQTGVPGGGKDACQGDSGGGVYQVQNGEPYQVGITSWGYGCALDDKWGHNTRVTEGLAKWIRGKIGPEVTEEEGGGSMSWLLIPLAFMGVRKCLV